jgi:5-methylcytosine-specific restriction endonuclease McrA
MEDGDYVIVSRFEARRLGLTHYFTGNPCKNGHLSPRMTKWKLCLACHRERRAKFRADSPDTVKEQKAASYLRHREKTIEKSVAYIAANPDKVFIRRKKYREANKPALAAINAEWRAANRHISRQHERNRRARKRGAEGSHTAAEVAELMDRQRGKCANPICRKPIRKAFHVDHIIALASGGTNFIRNIQLLCAPCNQGKHAKDPIDWARQNGLLI